MAFLLDTNICSAHLRRPGGLMHRFVQYSGRHYVPTIVVGELFTWAYLKPDPTGFISRIENDLLRDLKVLAFDQESAEEFGRSRATMLKQGLDASRIDLMIGCVAKVHGLTLVTNNFIDFKNIPDLQIVDWL